ncbi:MAG: HAD family hydrolase [Clostridia bacterium]|nr:HAD family hydrolase [Clostridia bacterium]
MFKIIGTDLDGTLLRNDKSISQYTKDVLQQATEKGVEFVICTGRMYKALQYILPELPFCRYSVTIMGAEIYDVKENKVIYSEPLDAQYVDFLIKYGLENNLHVQIYIDNELYTNSSDKYSEYYFQNTTVNGIEVDDLAAFAKGKTVAKVLFIDEIDVIEKHINNLREIMQGKINICNSDLHYLECSSLNARKDVAMNYLTSALGYKKDELIVFGDSGNDLLMLKNTGFSCVTQNGTDEAKAVADLIIESNEDDGVAKTVERLILNGE